MENQALISWRAIRFRKIDRAWAAVVLLPILLGLLAPSQFLPTLEFTFDAFMTTLPLIAFAVLMTACLTAADAKSLIAGVFKRRKHLMIVSAALIGGLSPFCSCEVIPFIAALLVAGAPLSAVMAFWLSSPIMDPPMFVITAGALGVEFAIAKTACAVLVGLLGGFGTAAIESVGGLRNPMRPDLEATSCCGSAIKDGGTKWRFWEDADRRAAFRATLIENAKFLSKWLILAYMLEALMLAWVPPEWIAGALGGDGFLSVVTGAAIGIPAYLNGYAAVPLVAGLIEQGMAQGAAMAFLVGGGITCIPAAIAVWALVRHNAFACYLAFAIVGAVLSGMLWGVAAQSAIL